MKIINIFSKRITAFLLCICLLMSLGLSAIAAAEDNYTNTEPLIVSAQVNVLPQYADWNEVITFNVVTDTNTSKVKICREDESVYLLADILSGFSGYTDIGNERTWQIEKRVEIKRAVDLYVYAGNCCFGYSDDYKVIQCEKPDDYINVESVTLNKTELELPVGESFLLTATVAPADATNKEITWASGNSDVATVNSGVVRAISEGNATITATADGINAICNVTVTKKTDQNEPPYPFWKNYLTYTGGETVYYKGNIYTCNYWAKGEQYNPEARAGAEWTLVGDAEWTVPELESNYTIESDPELFAHIGEVVELSDAEAIERWGVDNEEYTPEKAVARLSELISKEDYEALFPYRYGSENWKNLPTDYPGFSDTKYMGEDRKSKPDYYSYENLVDAVKWLANSKVKISQVEDADYCTRISCYDKTTKKEIVLYQHGDWTEEWNITKPRITKIIDLGAFLADGSLRDRKRELAAFLANISHENGGGWLEGKIDELYTGLYWNEEINHIGATSSGYLDSAYDYCEGVSYHGRGPIQISWNYNYAQFSGIVYGDCRVLLEHPERVVEDGKLGFMSAIWFWMTPQPPKPSCHSVMIDGLWTPSEKDMAQGRSEAGFGMTIMIINGGLEGNCTEADGRVGRRIRYYRHFTEVMGIDITGEKLDTAGMLSFNLIYQLLLKL